MDQPIRPGEAMTFKEFLNSLTLEQAREWDATNEKWLWIDHNLICDSGLVMTDRIVQKIEARFEELLAR